jgi:hypothetical protein
MFTSCDVANIFHLLLYLRTEYAWSGSLDSRFSISS